MHCIFIYGLLNDAVSNSGYIENNDWMINEQLIGLLMLKEAVLVWFEVLSRNLLGGLRQTTNSFSQDSRSLGRDLFPNTKQACQPLGCDRFFQVKYFVRLKKFFTVLRHFEIEDYTIL
jgi:hypothetical protein